MPKAFSEQEQAVIRAQLREQGQRLFTIYGLKKTSVDDLTQAVGISKGAFYLFYGSKEALMMEILEQIEETMQTRILDYVTQQDRGARENVRTILTQFLLLWDDYPLLKQFGQEEYMLLVRKLPAERVQSHVDQDERFINNFTEKLRREGIVMHTAPSVVVNLIKSLFFVSLHRADLGDEAYRETMAILVDLVAGHIIGDA